MKAEFTLAALADLDEILAYTSENYPALVESVERRIRDVVAHIEEWPRNARMLSGRPDVRVVPLLRYPYKIFYQILAGRIEILHIPPHGPRTVAALVWADESGRIALGSFP